jgi:putative SOS response-associated peptidase YedK
MMTDSNEAIRPVHDRMPVLLMPDEWDPWMHGSFDDVVAFQNRCFPDDLIEMRRTRDPWIKRTPPAASAGTLL